MQWETFANSWHDWYLCNQVGCDQVKSSIVNTCHMRIHSRTALLHNPYSELQTMFNSEVYVSNNTSWIQVSIWLTSTRICELIVIQLLTNLIIECDIKGQLYHETSALHTRLQTPVQKLLQTRFICNFFSTTWGKICSTTSHINTIILYGTYVESIPIYGINIPIS